MFRCVQCGDSKKSKYKTRGSLFPRGDHLVYGCFNCGFGTTFKKFLRRIDYDVFREYVAANYTNATYGTLETVYKKKEEKVEDVYIQDEDKSSIFDTVPTLWELHKSNPKHPAIQYCVERRLVKKHLENLYYVENFVEWSNKIGHKELDAKFDKPRIVAPMTTASGIEFGYQGRSIDPKENPRFKYMTMFMDDRFTKCFGMHIIDMKKPIWILEGVYDALFFPNAIAALDSSLSSTAKKLKLDKSQCIMLHDNQPRNKEIVHQIASSVEQGFPTVFWPEKYEALGKDVNEIIQAGVPLKELYDDLKNNIRQGLKAKLELVKWKKI